MARRTLRERPDREEVLWPVQKMCPACGHPMRLRYDNCRTLVTLAGPVRLRLKIRRCEAADCSQRHRPYRPEAEGSIALPEHEFGLDVIALVGMLRHREHRSVPEIHQTLRAREVAIAERSVTNLLDRYDELLATSLSDSTRLRRRLAAQGRVILALDGLQPDVGHEVLWVIRDCLSGEVLLARSLLSGTADDLAPLLREVADAGRVAVIEADRHTKKTLKKHIRGVRRIERAVEDAFDPQAKVVRGYCAAVRSAITDAAHPPLAASGLKLKGRLEAVAGSLERVAEKGGRRRRLSR